MKRLKVVLLLGLQFQDCSPFTQVISRKSSFFPSFPTSPCLLSHPSRSTTTCTFTSLTRSSSNCHLFNTIPQPTRTSLSSSSSSSQSSSSPSAEFTLDNLQTKLVFQTLIRIAIPSLSAAFLCFITFSPITHAIFTYVQTSFNGVETGTGYEALNLILTDNSNQFIQNAHNFLALNFCFLTTYTFSFLYNNQVKLYQALYDEVGTLISLLEQIALSTEGRVDLYKMLLLCIRKYINDDLKVVTKLSSTSESTKHLSNVDQQDLPVLLVSQRPQQDPLETILYLTSVGQPSHVYSTIKSLRQARANRLASLQRKMPEVNMYLLYILGFFAWVTFPIVTAGSSTVGGEELINVYRNELSLGIFAMGGVLGIINELKQPEVGSAYNVDYNLLGKLLDGLDEELNFRLSKCGLNLDSAAGAGGGSNLSKKELDELSSKLVASTFEMSENIEGSSSRADDFGAVGIHELSKITPRGGGAATENCKMESNVNESLKGKRFSWFRRRSPKKK